MGTIQGIINGVFQFLLNCVTVLLSPVFAFIRTIDIITPRIDDVISSIAGLGADCLEALGKAVGLARELLALDFALELIAAFVGIYLLVKGFQFLWNTVGKKYIGDIFANFRTKV